MPSCVVWTAGLIERSAIDEGRQDISLLWRVAVKVCGVVGGLDQASH